MPTNDYLAKMRELLQEAGEFDDDEIKEIVKVARGYAGGMTSARNKKAQKEMPEEDKGMMAQVMDMMKAMMSKLGMKGTESLSEPVQAGPSWVAVEPDGKHFTEVPLVFAVAPETIQILPKPGIYSHPSYGQIALTKEDLAQFVANHEAGVYGQNVPLELDIEHSEEDLVRRGAVGYIKGLTPIDDYAGGVAAQVEWTDRGREALESDAYHYVSPEWYEDWQHPTTMELYHNILSGGGITTHPYFKTDVLAPLVASEQPGGRRVYLLSDQATFAAGHSGHGGAHSSHGGKSGAKTSIAPKKAVGLLTRRRGELLGELRTIRKFQRRDPDMMSDPVTKSYFNDLRRSLVSTRSELQRNRAKLKKRSSERLSFADNVFDAVPGEIRDIWDDVFSVLEGIAGLTDNDIQSMSAKEATQTADMLSEFIAELEEETGSKSKGAEKPFRIEDGESYPAEAYLYTPDKEKPSTWKLRVWESPSEKVTRAQLGAAAAALSSGGFRGQPVQMPEEDKKKCEAQLRALYKAEGVKNEDMPEHLQANLDPDDVHVPGFIKIKKGGELMEIKLTEEQRQAIAVGEDLVLTDAQLASTEPKEASERLTATETALRKANERLEAVEQERVAERKEARKRRFTEIAQGRAQGTPFDGPAFMGEVAKHVSTMEVLAEAAGEDSDTFRDYVNMQHAHAEQVRSAGLFTELGHPGHNTEDSAEGEVLRRAREKGGDFTQAMRDVLRADPALARRYSEERNAKARVK